MKKIALILGIGIFLDIFSFAYLNKGQSLMFTYKPIFDHFTFDAGAGFLLIGLYGALGAFLIAYFQTKSLDDKIKKQARKVEKADVVTEENSDKVKLLQAKINTLETALEEALKRK